MVPFASSADLVKLIYHLVSDLFGLFDLFYLFDLSDHADLFFL